MLTYADVFGPAGKGGTYNPDEISEYKAHLEELDNDAAERAQEWIAYGQQMLERHVQRAKEELDKFFEAMRNVDTDITLLEAVDKQVPSPGPSFRTSKASNVLTLLQAGAKPWPCAARSLASPALICTFALVKY